MRKNINILIERSKYKFIEEEKNIKVKLLRDFISLIIIKALKIIVFTH